MTTAARNTPAMGRGASIALWIVTALMTIFFAMMGLPKVLGGGGWAGRFAAWGYPPRFVILVGVGELAGAALLLIPSLATLGGAGLAVIMLGAAATHLLHGESARVAVPLVLCAFLTVIAWVRRRKFLR